MIRNFYFIILTFLVLSCTHDQELETQAYPILQTLAVTDISPDGATLNGEILNLGTEEILRFGFVFDLEDPDVDHSDTVLISMAPKEKVFSVTLDDAFVANLKYKVRFFAITTNHILYGNAVEFESKGSKWNPWIFVNMYGINTITFTASNNENAFLLSSYGVFYKFNPEDDEIISRRNAPENGHTHNYACYYLGDYIYTLDLSDAMFLRYDRINNVWTNLGTSRPALPNRRYGFVIGETGYFISTGHMYIYDESHNSWIPKTALSATNIIYSVQVIGQNVYVFTDNQEIWKYTSSSDSWEKETDFPGIWKGNITGFAVKNKLYFGLSYMPNYYGEPVISPSQDFWEYSIETKTWKRMKDFPLEHSKNGVFNFSIQDNGYFGFYDHLPHQVILYKFASDKIH